MGMDYTLPPATATTDVGVVGPLHARYGELANFRRNCDVCVSGDNCQACLLWRKLRGDYFQGSLTSLQCTQAERCFQTNDQAHTFMRTGATDPGHYLLLPGSKTADWPVIGIEDRQVLSGKMEEIWDLAWRLAFKPYAELSYVPAGSVADLPVSRTSCNIGLALNPASARSQHQLAINVARIPATVRRLFVGRRANYGTWTKVTIPITKQMPSEWPLAYARYFSLPSGAPGPSMYGIFHQAFSFAHFDWLFLQAWGIMIIPDEASIDLGKPNCPMPQGFYLVLSTNNRIGSWNPFSAGGGPTPATGENAHYDPELLLCTDYSTGAGNYWTRQECYGDNALMQRTAAAGATSRFTDKLVAQQVQQDSK